MLPFEFTRFDTDHYLLVNESGEYMFLDDGTFEKLIHNNVEPTDNNYHQLKSRHFIYTKNLEETIELVSAKYRSRKRFLSDFTTLHMMVLTLKCSNDCRYCQVSAENEAASEYDMSIEVAEKIIDLIFKSPSFFIKIEFQGGEPTLNWNTLKNAVLYAEELNKLHHKSLDFVVCTNLVTITEEQLNFFKKHNIHISTSLDGPKSIHDKNRILKNGKGTYEAFIKNLSLSRKILGKSQVNALMTTTCDNINRLTEVVDEYIKLDFNGIFIRPLNPYGFALTKSDNSEYLIEDFVNSFESVLNYIINLNLNGVRFVEFYTRLLLTRILTPFSTGFVDLQSPSGAGISGVIYDFNGDVYPADEGRMLARMGDAHFYMGNALADSYDTIFGGSIIRDIARRSCLEVMPYCATCVYRAYCGADPIRNYTETGDIMGKRPESDFCKKNKLIFDILFRKIKENNADEMDVFWSWI
jgi:His-Xaa-Ser system radical SAM maturase HxsB